MNLIQIVFFVPLLYMAFYLIAWLYARRNFHDGQD